MRRTHLLLAVTAGLALIALVLGLPVITSKAPQPTSNTAQDRSGALLVEGRLSHPLVPTSGTELFATVDVRGVELDGTPERKPVNLALVIDRSGSMHGEKLAHAKRAAHQLIAQLSKDDRLAIVHYGSDVESSPSLPMTPAHKEELRRFVDGIIDYGGTNIGEGLLAGRRAVEANAREYRVNRIILVSDGQPTQGETNPSALSDISSEIRRSGISVSAIGVGLDFNESLMQTIAELGSGAYGYLNDAAKLAGLFQRDLELAATMVARDVELSFELPPGTQLLDVLGYRHRLEGRTVRVHLPSFSAGQHERVVARLLVSGGAPNATIDVAGLRVAYQDLIRGKNAEAKLTLAALASDDGKEVLARRDADAFFAATQAQAAVNLDKAADLLKLGKKAEAQQALQANEALYEGAAPLVPAPRLELERKTMRAFGQAFGGAGASPEAVQDTVKRAKESSRKGVGRIGSTY